MVKVPVLTERGNRKDNLSLTDHGLTQVQGSFHAPVGKHRDI